MGSESFLTMMNHRAPVLVVETEWDEQPTEMLAPVLHRLGKEPDAASKKEILRLLGNRALSEMRAFYTQHDGADICFSAEATDDDDRIPLVTLHPASRWSEMTATYRGEGEWAWTVDLCGCKAARTFYRGDADWIVIGRVNEGPGCLTTFLDGPDAGKVYFLAPEPRSNIVRPIAQSFDALLTRIADDVAAFMRRVRATVSWSSPHGNCHGLRALGYRAL